MSLLTLPAHFDGEKICLDEPYRLTPSAKLMVVILPEQVKESWPSTDLRCDDLPELYSAGLRTRGKTSQVFKTCEVSVQSHPFLHASLPFEKIFRWGAIAPQTPQRIK
ncbi:hypothetical protein U14_03227 [Candidatus Moduliflexus flocculans]|uniref:Uncharacterized protein n=1 Tax=Candidatus Moduliflexus flocculans TaxID=1499966 RepID=A0A081BNL5_9BACT|nr:hypothetical protein U14_03227 [Candidatus Moduliflexus flocculans]